ncbi:MAG: DUF3800 domain-containing protein [Lentisphaerae bacterium]|nr:DUF3800 domain-containing protein [Lentisphaerota bacterium]
MWWLYLDESGDLGFDFVNAKPSEFFTVCILATSSRETNRQFRYAVKKTLKRKLNHKPKTKRMVEELKATHTSLAVKEYALGLLEDHRFGIYALTLNKKRLFSRLAEDKERVYNYVSRLVIDQIPFEKASDGIHLTIDRSKGPRRIWEFNEYLSHQLEGRIDPSVSLVIEHVDSKCSAGVQFADLFAWGIFQKYEKSDSSWCQAFARRVVYDQQYL